MIDAETAARYAIIGYRLGVRHALEGMIITSETHVNPDLAITSSVALEEMNGNAGTR